MRAWITIYTLMVCVYIFIYGLVAVGRALAGARTYRTHTYTRESAPVHRHTHGSVAAAAAARARGE